MCVRDFLKVFSDGSVIFRVESSDGSFPVICRSVVSQGHFDGAEPLYRFEYLDCRIIDIIHTPHAVHVFIVE